MDKYVLVWEACGCSLYWTRDGRWTRHNKPDRNSGSPGALLMPFALAVTTREQFDAGPRLSLELV